MNQDISQMDVKEAFFMLQQFVEEKEELDRDDNLKYEGIEEVYDEVRYGIKEKFDIYDFIYGVVQIKAKTGKALYRGKTMNLTSFWTEIEQRTMKARKWLKDHMEDGMTLLPYSK